MSLFNIIGFVFRFYVNLFMSRGKKKSCSLRPAEALCTIFMVKQVKDFDFLPPVILSHTLA